MPSFDKALFSVRRVAAHDRQTYLGLARAFYASGAALMDAPDENILRTFDELMRSHDYAEAFLAEYDGETAGFVLLAKTFSQEAGGMVLWLEELYIRPEFRGMGLGSEVFGFLHAHYKTSVRRIRLEVEAENEGARQLYYRWGFENLPYEQMLLESEAETHPACE